MKTTRFFRNPYPNNILYLFYKESVGLGFFIRYI